MELVGSSDNTSDLKVDSAAYMTLKRDSDGRGDSSVKKQIAFLVQDEKQGEKRFLGDAFARRPISSCGFAQLGNPGVSRSKSARKKAASLWTVDESRRQIETNRVQNSDAVDDLLNKTSSEPHLSPMTPSYCDVVEGTEGLIAQYNVPRLVEVSDKVSGNASNVVSFNRKNDRLFSAEAAPLIPSPKGKGIIRQVNSLEKGTTRQDSVDCLCTFELRSIFVHIWLPRTYVSRAILTCLGQNASKETFDNNSDDTRETLEKLILEETKRDAISIFRPTGERLGWTEDTLEDSFVVDIYSDAGSTDNQSTGSQAVRARAKFGSMSTFDRLGFHYENEIEGENDPDFQTWFAPLGGQEESSNNNGDIRSSVDNNRHGAIADTSGKIAEFSDANGDGNKEAREYGKESNAKIDSFTKALLDGAWFKQKKQDLAILVAILFGFVILGGSTRVLFFRKRKRRVVENDSKKEEISNAAKANGRGKSNDSSFHPRGRLIDFSELEDDENEAELETELGRLAFGTIRKHKGGTDEKSVGSKDDLGEFSNKRREALEFISRYPERAAASLQNWVKGSNL